MAESSNGMNRRRFLKVLGVTGGGAAVLSGCSTDKAEKLIPYIVPPDNQVPGIATWYATTCRECPAGCGLHVRVREGRAVKVEGNPDHPVNGGRLCARGQASLQGLYNPDRIRAPMARSTTTGEFAPITWDDAVARIASRLGEIDGAGIRFVTGAESGSFGRLVREWLAAYGSRGHLAFEPFAYEALRHAGRTVFGIDAPPRYDFSAARYVLSFGTDFLETFGSPVSQAREFAQGHGYGADGMGRYVHVEPRMSLTAMSADEWVAPHPGTDALVALAIAEVIVRDRLTALPADVGRLRGMLERYAPESVAEATGVPADTIERLAREFVAAPSLALAGGVGAQHDAAHATAHAAGVLNYVAGNVGRTVFFDRDAPSPPATYAEVAALVGEMREGAVAAVFVHGANPVHATPPSLGFGEALRGVPFKVSFSRFLDETAAECDLVLPDHDPLEQWNDDVPRAGVRSLQQPVMRPVFDTRQTGDVLLDVVARRSQVPATLGVGTYRAYLQQVWTGVQRDLGDRRAFDAFWTEALSRGGVWRDAASRPVALAASAGNAPDSDRWTPVDGRLALIAYPSATLYDGRGANRPWLQELPDPVTKITWSTWVELHPETAAEHGIAEGDIVELTTDAGSLRVPAYLYPGLHRGVAAVPMGQGHTAFGRYAEGRGANVLALLSGAPTACGGIGTYGSVGLRHTGEHEFLPKTEGVPRQLGRGIARAIPLAEVGHEGGEAHEGHAAPVPERIEGVLDRWQEGQDEATKYGNYEGALPRWGMAVDLSRCTGCSACVTACYAENNLPTVGPEQVRRGREMSWIRIERYFEVGEHGEPFEARVVPMMCQQCSSAPCEPVCPVFAAYHTPDGLNGQVYNRCVGTRYCSNNCPYKVRYFNYFDYQAAADPAFAWPEPLHWLLNPDVTVRSKGVMEKCTFCVQRIRDRQNQAKLQKRDTLEDGEILTACQQTCPSEAIVFGDLNDPDSRVARLARDRRQYHVLGDLNTRPAVTYLEKVRNLVEA
jgi:anaerobic selenocysteine-containing dehydrogenase/Fe-S-cluster-containing dehydrogenase component